MRDVGSCEETIDESSLSANLWYKSTGFPDGGVVGIRVGVCPAISYARWGEGSSAELMQEVALAISLILLVPYLGWGVYALRLRYRYHEELPPVVEIITLAALLLYFGFEIMALEAWMSSEPIVYLFTVLA